MRKRLIIGFMFCLVATGLIFANGGGDDTAAAEEKAKLHCFFNEIFADDPAFGPTLDLFLAENPDIELEINSITKGTEAEQKVVVLMASGVPVDIFKSNNPIVLANFIDAGATKPLNEYADKYGLDPDTYWGAAKGMVMKGDELHAIAINKTQWLMYYNKSIFDAAGVSYPSDTVPMTWTEYQETAKMLTQGEGYDKKYGALHLQWQMYFYGSAIQKLGGGEKFYKADGSSNIMDPAFKEAAVRFKEMQDVDKSVPTYSEVISQKIKATDWMSGKYGMYVHGNWLFPWAKDSENYPRDYKIGIAPMPVYEGSDHPYSWGIIDGYSVGTNANYPDEAFRLLKYIADNLGANYAGGPLPASNLSELSGVSSTVAAGLEADGITAAQFEKIMFDPSIDLVTEKIAGPSNTEYQKIYTEEMEKYFIDAQSIDEALALIETRVNKLLGK